MPQKNSLLFFHQEITFATVTVQYGPPSSYKMYWNF